jgi:hypothetical protein
VNGIQIDERKGVDVSVSEADVVAVVSMYTNSFRSTRPTDHSMWLPVPVTILQDQLVAWSRA